MMRSWVLAVTLILAPPAVAAELPVADWPVLKDDGETGRGRD